MYVCREVLWARETEQTPQTFLFTKTAGHKTSPWSICYIVITPLSFFLCPNPLPPMTPARLDPTNPSPPFPLRGPQRYSTSVPSDSKGLFHQKTLLLTKTEFEWLACFQVQPHRLNHWGEKFCFVDGRSRTAMKTNKYQGTLKRKRSAPRMGSYIPRCKISLASFSLCQVKNVLPACVEALSRSLSALIPSTSLASLDSSPDVTKRSFAGYSYCRYLSVQSTKFLFRGY